MATKPPTRQSGRLGVFLQDARVRAGLHQKDVAKALGYGSAQFISDWERGLRSPPARIIKKLAELYGLSVEEFFEMILQEKMALLEEEMRQEFKMATRGRR